MVARLYVSLFVAHHSRHSYWHLHVGSLQKYTVKTQVYFFVEDILLVRSFLSHIFSLFAQFVTLFCCPPIRLNISVRRTQDQSKARCDIRMSQNSCLIKRHNCVDNKCITLHSRHYYYFSHSMKEYAYKVAKPAFRRTLEARVLLAKINRLVHASSPLNY